MITTILAFIFVFGLLVFAHEAGHFGAAKLFKVKVIEFAFGFPPKIWAKKIKDTIYAINAIPIGGYVRLFGEDGEGKNKKDSLESKKPWQKATVFGAGVFMNVVLAWLLLTGFYLVGGRALIPGMWEHSGIINNQKVMVVDVAKDSPAQKEGILAGDQITTVNGKKVYSDDLLFTEVQKSTPEKPVTVIIKRDNQEFEKKISSYTDKIKSNDKEVEVRRIGISMETKGNIRSVWYLAPWNAAKETGKILKITIVGFVDFFKTVFTKFRVAEGVGGPVAIFSYTGVAASLGFGVLIQFTAILSISLAVLNILPFPALDGGHIFLLGIEKLSGKKIKKETKETINKIGFAILLILIVLVTLSDLGKFGIFNFLKR